MTASSAKLSSASDRKSPLVLGPAQVHLWLRRQNEVGDSGAFLRAVLSRYADSVPGDWCIVEGEHGRPGLVDPPLPLSFNISHSGAWIACAVSPGDQVGVDIEQTARERGVMRLARRFFHPEETAALERLGDCLEQRQRFYDYWTLKEAAVKARGLALGPALTTATFDLRPGDGSGPLALRARGQPDRRAATHYLLDPVPDYRLALCVLGGPRKLELFLDGPGLEGMCPVPASMLRGEPSLP